MLSARAMRGCLGTLLLGFSVALGCMKSNVIEPVPDAGPSTQNPGRSMPTPVPSEPKPMPDPTGPLPMPPGMPVPPVDATPPPPVTPPPPPIARAVSARLLLLAGSGNEPTLAAMRRFLDYAGVPYDVWIVAMRGAAPKAADLMRDVAGRKEGNYQGIVMATTPLVITEGTSGEDARSALTEEDLRTLATYQVEFGVRQLNLYTYPTPEYGFEPPAQSGNMRIDASVTNAGRAVFAHLAQTIPIADAWLYLSKPAPAQVGTSVTPLLADAQGNALAALYKFRDGRENLSLTFDGAYYLRHTLALSLDLLRWVTSGIFVGDFRVYASAQVDDYFIENNLWPEPEGSNLLYRMTGADLTATVNWQNAERGLPTTSGFALDLAFCGVGTTGDYLLGDTLLPATRMLQQNFKWINHTFTHLDLNAADYMAAQKDMADNLGVAKAFGLGQFSTASMVTPNISGLNNPMALRAAWDLGVRFVVSDTSRLTAEPVANLGAYSPHQPGLLQIPRRPTNLFYNVSTPAEWAGEYNGFYGESGSVRPPVGWGVDLSYDQILDRESDVLVRYMLSGESYPWMFHQANLRAYDGRHALLGDLLGRTFAKYRSYLDLPVLSPTMETLGNRIAERMERLKGRPEVVRLLAPEAALLLSSNREVRVPITGVATGADMEQYGNDVTSFVLIRANVAPIKIPLAK